MFIYETPDSWGNDTIYADYHAMQAEIASLQTISEEWRDINISHCRRWRQVAGDIFQQVGKRFPETARLFIIGGGFYKFYPAYEDEKAQAAIWRLAELLEGDDDWALNTLEEYVGDNSFTGDPDQSLRDWLAAGSWTGSETPDQIIEAWDNRD